MFALAACGGAGARAVAAAPQKPARKVARQVEPALAKPPDLYDVGGNLLPSDKQVAWLELPRGLKEVPSGIDDHHAYRTEGIPIDRIQAFFGARVVSGSHQEPGAAGMRMERGVPATGMKPKLPLLDVVVAPAREAGVVNVWVDVHPFVPSVPVFTDTDARALLKEQQKVAE